MDIPGRRSGPGMSEQLLDREQVHPRQIELAGAKVPQDMRCQLPRPARQVLRGGDGQSPSEYLCGYSTAGAVEILAFGGNSGAPILV